MGYAFSAWISGRLAPHVSSLLKSSRPTKRLIAALSDILSCVLSAWVAFGLRLGVLYVFTDAFAIFTATAVVVVAIVFVTSGVYNNVFRFHGPRGLAQIARCCLIVMGVLVVIFGLISVPGVPRTVSIIFPAAFFAAVAVSRIVARFVLIEMFESGDRPQHVLIYGAGSAGRQLASSLQHEPGYRLVAFADDDPSLAGQSLEGTPILTWDQLAPELAAEKFDLVLLALPTISRSERAAIVERLHVYGVHVQTLPGIHKILAGEVSVSDLREIEISDLLSRDPILPDPLLMDRAIAGQDVLVTGAGGSIGSELCRQILRRAPKRLVLFEMTEAALFTVNNELLAIAAAEGIDCELVPELGTLVNPNSVERLFAKWKPDTVFHAAAYKHVPLVEANPVAGVRNNVLGTLHCVQSALNTGVKRFVLVSTDKAVRPTNVMGASKRVCELVLQAMAGQMDRDGTVFAIVRFGNVLGSSGSVVPQFRRQIADGGPITLTHRDVTRFFMTIPEAAELVIQAGAMAYGGEIYLLDMGEAVKIYDLARSMIQMSGRSLRDANNPGGDIEITEIGLRPGEKLYEELLIGAEAMPTDHPRIFRAHEAGLPWEQLSPVLEAMNEAIQAGDEGRIRVLLGDLVDGYAATSALPQGAVDTAAAAVMKARA